MSAAEFITWQAWLRRNPRGLAWENWVQASIHRAIVIGGRGGSSKGVPKLDAFHYKPPTPMFALRMKLEAKGPAPSPRKSRSRKKARSE